MQANYLDPVYLNNIASLPRMKPLLAAKNFIKYRFPAKSSADLSRFQVLPPSNVLKSDPEPPHAYARSDERKPKSNMPKPRLCSFVVEKSSDTPCSFPNKTSPPLVVSQRQPFGFQPIFCILLPVGRL